ncbi:16S rRNA (guanine(527)-N(7))-methyltransferase RsmG [Mailhella sp.]|uniref:16S rRNA (guanine(527)-N(7))-methyltransferase RsmG n=1 Tax=Mailhella sp. TaxID=1981029 RepID=UPI003AB78F11
MARHDDCSPAVIKTLCEKAGFPLDASQASQLVGYLDLLMRWNKMMNLVGARHWRDALDELILDSFHLAAFLRSRILPHLPGAPVTWDLGAGAGLPGIPLRIVWQDGSYWMVESRDKRTIFLSTVLARYPLKNTHVFRGRAEQFMEGKQADLIVSRAFMPWKELLSFVRGHLSEGGCIVFLTREPLNRENDLPWDMTASMRYTVGNADRYFCAFTERRD